MSDRKPKPQSAAAPERPGASLPAGRAILCLRFWRIGEAAISLDALRQQQHPAVLLWTDLLQACGATLLDTPRNELLAASFEDLSKAIRAARRLQWAMEGFTQSNSSQSLAIGVLVAAREEVGDFPASLPTAMEKTAPGGILLTEQAVQAIAGLAGYTLQASSETALTHLNWRNTGEQSSGSADQQTLAALIAQKGAEFAAAFEREDQAAAVAESVEFDAVPTPPVEQQRASGRSEKLSAFNPSGRLSWIAGGAVVLAVVLVIYFMPHHKRQIPAPEPVARTFASEPTPTAATPAAPTQSRQEEPPHPAPPVAKVKTPAVAKPAPVTSKQASAPHGKCDLDPGMVDGQIELAEKNLARGKYKDAQRQFEAALGCEPNNVRARDGLNRVHQALQAEGLLN